MNRGSVLVTGGAGYIGSHVVLSLIDRGFSPVVLDNLSTGSSDALVANVPFYKGDVADRRLVQEISETHSLTAAMHFAAHISVPESIANPSRYYFNNTANSLAFFGNMIDAGVKNFIFSSTAAVYGACDRGVAHETDVCTPLNPYGWSKLFVEQMLTDISLAREDVSVTVLRYFNVAGADPLGRAGQRNAGAAHLIRMAIDVALGVKEKLVVFGDDYETPDGTCIRDFIHVSDLAEAHVLALEAMDGRDRFRLFNCGYGIGSSVLTVVHTLEGIVGRKIPFEVVGRRPGDAPRVVAASELIQEKLGWRPKHNNLVEIISSALHWQQHISGRT